ncbi:MAG: response regulator [Rhodospirillales bacterium]|nr:response regulator [Rhodospirillales bacterium]
MQLPIQVALVDDDDLYRETVAADLADRGFAVSGFADGRSFFDALHNGLEAHVVLLDWSLQEGSGLDLLNTLREGGRQVPVVFLTGVSLAERELQAFNGGAVDFIDKLRGIDVLAQRLRLIVEGERARPADAAPTPLRYGNLTLLPGTARAQWCRQDVGLTVTEYKIVAFLASLEGEPASYRAIYDVAHYSGFVAGTGERGYQTNVRSLMKRIRGKFLSVDPGFSQIVNWPYLGYSWLRP